MKKMFGLALLIAQFNYAVAQKTSCAKCDIEILAAVNRDMAMLSFKQVLALFCTMDNSCAENVEFSEFSGELIFQVFNHKPEFSLRALEKSSNSSADAVIKRLENPINDILDLNLIYSKVSSIAAHKKSKKRVLEALQLALNKSKK